MTSHPMGAEEFRKIGQALFGERQRGRGAWQGQFAVRLGMTAGRLRQIIRADTVPDQVALHARDIYRIYMLTGSADGPKPATEK